MSLESWKQEFYPKKAISFENIELTKENLINALDHAIKKWEGITRENLQKHACFVSFSEVRSRCDVLSVTIDSSTCSLCVMIRLLHSNCSKCPLYKHLKTECFEENEPYHVFEKTKSPIEMINALRETRDKLSSDSLPL
jgi:hypothetical protein